MTNCWGLVRALIGSSFCWAAAWPLWAALPEKPNIVIIFCDDLGYGDIGAYGAKGYKTPHLDRLAAEGNRFTRFYSAQPVCSASRAALLTGCYPNRIGIRGALGPKSPVGINDNEMTLGELAKQRGYATAIYGKWHLGDAPQFLPTHHGFDEYFGLPYSNDMWPFHPGIGTASKDGKQRPIFPDLPLIEGDKIINAKVSSDDQRQLTTWYTEHAVDFIRRHKAQPFLLYLPHSMPHVPLHVSDKFHGTSQQGLYGDVIQEIDWSVGEVLTELRNQGLDERTLVIFSSDNGPWLSYGNHAGSAGPLREGKATTWEGGVREPFIARWTGVIPADRVTNEPAMMIDVFPTIAALIGAPLPAHKIDGLNIWPLMVGEPNAESPHDAFYFYYADNELRAVADGRYKLSFPHSYQSIADRPRGRDGKPAPYTQGKVEAVQLYDLDRDVSESRDVASAHPDIVKRLEVLAEKARAELGDSLTKRTGAGVRPAGRLATDVKTQGK